jgi:hypothetical protein
MANARREGRVWHGPDSTGLGGPTVLVEADPHAADWSVPPRDQRVTPSFSGSRADRARRWSSALRPTTPPTTFCSFHFRSLLCVPAAEWRAFVAQPCQRCPGGCASSPTLRVGVETLVVLEVRNRKRVLPSYGLSFYLQAGGTGSSPGGAAAEGAARTPRRTVAHGVDLETECSEELFAVETHQRRLDCFRLAF